MGASGCSLDTTELRGFSSVSNEKRQNRVAVYPGSFDPLTNGHLDIARRAISRCPFVSGSKLPGYTATRFCLFSLLTLENPLNSVVSKEQLDAPIKSY